MLLAAIAENLIIPCPAEAISQGILLCVLQILSFNARKNGIPVKFRLAEFIACYILKSERSQLFLSCYTFLEHRRAHVCSRLKKSI